MIVYGLEDIVTISLAVLGFIVVICAQAYLSSAYGEGKKKKSGGGISGCEAAKKILEKNGLSDVYVVETHGELSDHYDPKRKVVRLSKDIFHGETIAAVAIAAHECGHAIQDKDGYTFMRIRALLVPTVNFITYMGYIVLFISLLAGAMGQYLVIALVLILAGLLFQLITLPVEFDASKRALNELEGLMLIDPEEKKASEKVLKAAAMTYVASVISSLLSLLRILIMMRNRD